MKCPFCGFEESKVVDSRSTDDNTTIRRRRECLKCNKRYTTYEKIEDFPILVIKKDLTRENFNKEKIINGLIIACQKRPISRKQIEEIAYDIEKTISNSMLTEIPSNEIGEMVMARLKELDEISYVRFASVYRQFKDIDTFLEEIKNLRT
ncbi:MULTISPECIES: transcriptional regulator NrdR [Clostridium]|jgi:transcriptional regulator NrdR|uniref:Transcriptional repressor NrdR n=5 Tax=Clostridium TaxID=1485 RepID=NRDR_CLOB8|nr:MULTISPECIES: transcriptional regulator NrdR [Clostridium]A6LSH5.1 RecName: Full=Transcriptional repressor NrdR [Clostridium beijerinckii NCIMB 8052]ABR33305.1 ATP-cone domain protein [Clostridium beijerinckii NCIMB 8052]AIU00337.1 transcriptional regulator NrdR [Clostridium beijerinckii ATCC 35702]ALB47545.1 transcriptional repressor NrdR [Clostridium beijerinckii NRRL B-598]AQS03769.1 transcriptional repressor NrdR [Clostridium beijerinckii]AVK50183.1 NrdR family transcriptional regulato